MRLSLKVNGRGWSGEVEPRLTLADLLRDHLRLTETKLGCEQGVCGACTVLVDGAPARSCLQLAVQLDGCEVTTAEALPAFDGIDFQCGFCRPGITCSGSVDGHVCRCTGYPRVRESLPRLPGEYPAQPGEGGREYLADLPHDGALEVAFVRSPYAHAAVRSTTGAGVTARDLDLADLPAGAAGPEFAWPALARDRVRFAGQAVAAVWAPTRAAAEDLADQVEVDYAPLPLEPARTLYSVERGGGDLDAAMARADLVLERVFRTARQAPLPLECRAVQATFQAGRLSLWSSTQVPHVLRRGLATALRLDETAIRVRVPRVGGGFGLKAHVFPEELVVAALAVRLGRAVRWIEDRTENLLAGSHAHDNEVRLRAGVTAAGQILAVDAEVDSDVGAYAVYPFGASLEPSTCSSAVFAPYAMDALRVRGRALSSHRCPVGAYRGVGTNTAVHATERMMDAVAAELGVDPLELRLRNVVTTIPGTTLTGRRLDSGDYAGLLSRLAEAAGYDRLRRSRDQARRQGRLVGVGLALFNEHSGTGATEYRSRGVFEVPGLDACRVQVMEDGRIRLSTSSVEIGQQHAGAYRAVAERELGIDAGRIEVAEGDTDLCPPGTGAFVSRGAVGLLEAVAGALRMAAAQDLAPGTDVTCTVDPEQVFPSGAHLAVVEVDPVGCVPRVTRYVAVEDCGTVIDERAVEGQVRGGVAMGVGKVLLEQFAYSADGQPLTAGLLDYLVPLAPDVPEVEIHHAPSPSPKTPLGSKGVGEAGTVGAFGAVANAVADAVAPLGAELTELPYSPNRIFQAIAMARQP